MFVFLAQWSLTIRVFPNGKVSVSAWLQPAYPATRLPAAPARILHARRSRTPVLGRTRAALRHCACTHPSAGARPTDARELTVPQLTARIPHLARVGPNATRFRQFHAPARQSSARRRSASSRRSSRAPASWPLLHSSVALIPLFRTLVSAEKVDPELLNDLPCVGERNQTGGSARCSAVASREAALRYAYIALAPSRRADSCNPRPHAHERPRTHTAPDSTTAPAPPPVRAHRRTRVDGAAYGVAVNGSPHSPIRMPATPTNAHAPPDPASHDASRLLSTPHATFAADRRRTLLMRRIRIRFHVPMGRVGAGTAADGWSNLVIRADRKEGTGVRACGRAELQRRTCGGWVCAPTRAAEHTHGRIRLHASLSRRRLRK
ncbi:hypothetical protein B0H17DRAFT_1208963 [Mycena rosella]|uniref:Uncharacterized protein n=1 Tax=Mycena rosella TaxID=1033263 RepID=A0AAD7D042_MYCRO|nr:hypothetical protein B0H17DRAFT_1208963 [Mycena rosella]